MFEEIHFFSMRRLYRLGFWRGPEGSPFRSFFFNSVADPDSMGLGTSSTELGGMMPGIPDL